MCDEISPPENLVQGLISALGGEYGFTSVEEVEIKDEDVRFSLPPELNAASRKFTTITV